MSRLNRWSQRKLSVEEEDASLTTTDPETIRAEPAPDGQLDANPVDPPEPVPPETEPVFEPDPAPGSLDHTLADPETLAPGSDIKAYLAPGVSAGLRRRALRQLFAAERYGIRDGLNDYDDDYRQKLAPLSQELAQRLRQWTRKPASVDETEESEATSDEAETPQEQLAEEESPALQEMPAESTETLAKWEENQRPESEQRDA